ncbi:MAG: hypothetical protein KDK09_13665 [Rhodobacteraceae bacterium]|nr:hypothetical protein [Paracoccaceae bacterium]
MDTQIFMRQMIVSKLLTLCLMLSLTASTLIAGVVQGRADTAIGPLTAIVICDTHGGTSTILVDEAGNRVDPNRHCGLVPCRDCLTIVAAFTPPVHTGPSLTLDARFERLTVFTASVRTRPAVFKPARAPPIEV